MITQFSQYLTEQGRSIHTIRGYVQDLTGFSRWFEQANGEALTPEGMTPTDVRQYRQAMITAKARPATVNRKLATLKTFGKFLVDTNGAPDNPAAKVKKVETMRLAPRWLDKKQQAALTRAIERMVQNAHSEAGRRQAVRDAAAVIVLLHTGLRVGELIALELADVELGERKGRVHVRNGKGGKARDIPLNKTAVEALRSWLELRGEAGGRIFTGKRGEDLTSSGIQRRLQVIGQAAGVAMTPHTLRHSFAKNLVDSGVSLEKIATLLGHSSLNTTRVYTIPGQSDLAAAVGLLDL